MWYGVPVDRPRTAVLLARDTKGSAALMEQAIERIRAFSYRHGGNGEVLATAVWKAYAERSLSVGCWALVNEDTGAVEGHLLADVRTWDHATVIWILQLEVDDHRPLSSEERSTCLSQLDGWTARYNQAAKAQGLQEAAEYLMSTPRDVAAWARQFGFEDFRAIKRRKLPTRG